VCSCSVLVRKKILKNAAPFRTKMKAMLGKNVRLEFYLQRPKVLHQLSLCLACLVSRSGQHAALKDLRQGIRSNNVVFQFSARSLADGPLTLLSVEEKTTRYKDTFSELSVQLTPKKRARVKTDQFFHEEREIKVLSSVPKEIRNVKGIMKLIMEYEFEPHKWEKHEVVTRGRMRDQEFCYCEGKLYAVGGKTDDRYFAKSAEFLDFNNLNYGWQKMANLSEEKIDFGVCCHEGKLYAVGGSNGRIISKGVECLDLKNLHDRWQKVASEMSEARARIGLCCYEGRQRKVLLAGFFLSREKHVCHDNRKEF
jgi:hypothetical protein